jgi:hypothetical protein
MGVYEELEMKISRIDIELLIFDLTDIFNKIKCFLHIHKWLNFNKTIMDCFRKCEHCNKLQYLYPYYFKDDDYSWETYNILFGDKK